MAIGRKLSVKLERMPRDNARFGTTGTKAVLHSQTKACFQRQLIRSAKF